MESFSPKKREQLERKMMEVFKEEAKRISPKFQQMLADDLVTAFKNRMIVFLRIQSKLSR